MQCCGGSRSVAVEEAVEADDERRGDRRPIRRRRERHQATGRLTEALDVTADPRDLSHLGQHARCQRGIQRRDEISRAAQALVCRVGLAAGKGDRAAESTDLRPQAHLAGRVPPHGRVRSARVSGLPACQADWAAARRSSRLRLEGRRQLCRPLEGRRRRRVAAAGGCLVGDRDEPCGEHLVGPDRRGSQLPRAPVGVLGPGEYRGECLVGGASL